MIDLSTACNKFFSDPQLSELLEVNKSSSDLLDLLSPRENQHTDILAWCFNSREGHDLGDTVLKDFLVAIYNASTDVEPGDQLHGKGLTKDFVRYWTPSRVATSSFGAAIFIREYALTGDGNGKNRIDLLIIDPDQKFLIVVENKSGAKHTKGQLTGYLDGIRQTLFNKSMFNDYHVAFVALDQYYDPESDDEDTENESFDPRWALLNYGWLGSAAKRAEHAIKRGNHAAELLRSYCLRQSGQIEYDDSRTRELIHSLARNHSVVFQELKEIRKVRSSPELWNKYRDDFHREHLLRMYIQNSPLWDQLIDLRPIEVLDAEIRRELDYLDDDNCEVRRLYSAYRTAEVSSIPDGRDGYWPLYIRVKHTNAKTGSEPRFLVAVKLRPQYFPENQRDFLIAKLSSIFPTLSKSRIQEKGKWLKVVQDLGIESAKKAVVEIEQLLADALRSK